MFKGMKWLKCDLQMQTPGDPYNWLNTCPAYIGKTYTSEQLTESVDLYLKRCHSIGLNVIGVTDHNFIGKDYLAKLIERNPIVANEIGKEKLVIFPGFEVEISQGLGVHILCLFDSDTPLEIIDDMVTELGLPKNKRVIGNAITPLEKNFNQLINFIQEREDYPGIVIAAHPLAESGMLKDSFVTDHFQRTMFLNPKLLALEVPKPVEELANGIQKLIKSSKDCHVEWKRNRPVAAVMSSDCYSLEDESKGYIGKRYSWIQFSNPTIESLKQAFIDHSSRIRLQNQNPDQELRYGKIKSLEINDVKFLEDQVISFSSNLNCVIGGRGSGKSTVLEYIRLATNAPTPFNEQVNRIKNTLNESSKIKIEFEDENGLIDTIEFYNEEIFIPTREAVTDINVLLRSLGINIYSQREITQMGQDSPSLMLLIDQIADEELLVRLRKENDLIDKINALILEEIRYDKLYQEKSQLEQELIELNRKWEAFSTINTFSENKNKVNFSKNLIVNVVNDKDLIVTNLTNLSTEIEDILRKYTNITLDDTKYVDPEYMNYIKKQFSGLLELCTGKLDSLKGEFTKGFLEITENHPNWLLLDDKYKIIEDEFKDACVNQGISEQEFSNLKDTELKISQKQNELSNLDSELVAIAENLGDIQNLQNELLEVWKNQSELRQSKVNRLINISTIPKVKVDEIDVPFLKIDIIYMGNENHFKMIWEDFPVSGRTRLGRNWCTLGELIYSEFKQNADQYITPWMVLDKWLADSESMPSEHRNLHTDLKGLLESNAKEWKNLYLKRIQDEINITLYRPDGTIAGSLLDNGLSDGQKNTAILTLLFTQGKGPILIDQPEDELDSDFIYNELIPIIRTMKIKRQIIIVTHNANLPVNGDAELVYALKTLQGKGIKRSEGGLDNPSVKEAVLDIMEGSAEAFKKRREKYEAELI